MKIGIITDCLDDSSAGISVLTANLIEHILKQDKENEYVLIHHTKNKHPLYKTTKELIVPLKNMPFAREYRKVIQLPKILEREGFDLVHETTQIGPFFRKGNYKKVVTICDLAPLRYPETFPKIQVWHHKLGLPIITRKVDKIIAISESTKRDIVELLGTPEDKVKTVLLALPSRPKLMNN